MSIALTQQEIGGRFSGIFPPKQSAKLEKEMDEMKVAERERANDTRELKQELTALTKELRQGLTALTKETRQLADAQRHTDERLAAFQQRTEERFVEMSTEIRSLTEAQRHTDERLAAYQQRTDEHFARLADSMQELRSAVGGLANRFGFDLEEFVADLLPPYLEKYHGICGLILERHYLGMEDIFEEVDLVGRGTRNGHILKVLVECRTTLRGGELRKIARKLKERVIPHLEEKEVVLVAVAMNAHPTAEDVGREEGVLVVPYSYVRRPELGKREIRGKNDG